MNPHDKQPVSLAGGGISKEIAMTNTKKRLSRMFSEAYNEALREGCDHDSAVDCALQEIAEDLQEMVGASANQLEIPVMPLLKGLGIQFSPDGTWLSFKDSHNNSSVIQLENLTDASGRSVNTTIQTWCREMRGSNIPSSAISRMTFMPDGSKRDSDPSDLEGDQ